MISTSINVIVDLRLKLQFLLASGLVLRLGSDLGLGLSI